LYSSPHIIKVIIKLGIRRKAGYVAGKVIHKGNHWEKLKERNHFGDLGVDGSIILKRKLNMVLGCRLDSS